MHIWHATALYQDNILNIWKSEIYSSTLINIIDQSMQTKTYVKINMNKVKQIKYKNLLTFESKRKARNAQQEEKSNTYKMLIIDSFKSWFLILTYINIYCYSLIIIFQIFAFIIIGFFLLFFISIQINTYFL